MNGWMAALDDRLLVPVGMSDPPALLALGLPTEGRCQVLELTEFVGSCRIRRLKGSDRDE